MKPLFLTLDEIFDIHLDQIERYGGAKGVRDRALLESSVAMPMAGVQTKYHHKDIFEQAAAYLFHIEKNHPFIDGNKRVGAVAAFVFLSLNGWRLEADETEFEELVLAVARGHVDKKTIAAFFRSNSMLER